MVFWPTPPTIKEIVEIIMKKGYNAMVLHLQEMEKEQ